MNNDIQSALAVLYQRQITSRDQLLTEALRVALTKKAVWGKFWVNNHAHILKGKSGFNEDSLYMLLRNTNVCGAVTGAVQLKINQANLKALKVLIPSAVDLEKYNSLLEPIFAFRRSCSEETQKLILTRDSLLPKLMSGEIRVPLEVK